MSDLFSLEKKTALVTGCATGIGQAMAVGLAEHGADIVAVDIADLTETTGLIRAVGRTCYTYHADLSNAAVIDSLWTDILSDVRSIDILFNNAGVQHRDFIQDFSEEMYDRILAINLKAAFLLSKKAASFFLQHHIKGKIINTASLNSRFGGYRIVAYTCAKHGIAGLTKALSNELAPYGICVNAIAPGYIETSVTHALWSDPVKKEEICQRIAMGRWGKPDDIKGAAIFLASRAADYISGTVLEVSGGYSAK